MVRWGRRWMRLAMAPFFQHPSPSRIKPTGTAGEQTRHRSAETASPSCEPYCWVLIRGRIEATLTIHVRTTLDEHGIGSHDDGVATWCNRRVEAGDEWTDNGAAFRGGGPEAR